MYQAIGAETTGRFQQRAQALARFFDRENYAQKLLLGLTRAWLSAGAGVSIAQQTGIKRTPASNNSTSRARAKTTITQNQMEIYRLKFPPFFILFPPIPLPLGYFLLRLLLVFIFSFELLIELPARPIIKAGDSTKSAEGSISTTQKPATKPFKCSGFYVVKAGEPRAKRAVRRNLGAAANWAGSC